MESFGQHDKKLIRGIETKNTKALFQSFNKHPKRKHEIYHYQLRDISGGFQSLSFKLIISQRNIDLDGRIYPYHFHIICSDSSIHQALILNGEDTLYFYSDSVKIDELKSTYKKDYGQEVKMKEIFKSNIVYGSGCGRYGIDPDERFQMKRAIKENDKNFLMNWLKSPILELNLYGLEGLAAIDDLELTKEEIEIIEKAKSKKGTARTCSGCEYTRRDFQYYSYLFSEIGL